MGLKIESEEMCRECLLKVHSRRNPVKKHRTLVMMARNGLQRSVTGEKGMCMVSVRHSFQFETSEGSHCSVSTYLSVGHIIANKIEHVLMSLVRECDH